MKYVMLIITLFFTQNAYACSLKGEFSEDQIYSVEVEKDRKYCTKFYVHFLKEISSRDDWMWAEPFVGLEVVKNDEGYREMSLPLQIHPSEKKPDHFSTQFCIPDDMISRAFLSIHYEEFPTAARKKGNPLPTSSCMKTINIDDLEELIVSKDKK